MKVSFDHLRKVAECVRPHITPFIEKTGGISDDDLRKLILKHSPSKVQSDRSIQYVQEFLCDC